MAAYVRPRDPDAGRQVAEVRRRARTYRNRSRYRRADARQATRRAIRDAA